MPHYRRLYQPGATIFLTLVTYNRYPYFSYPENVSKLRNAVATVKAEMPFEMTGAVVLPDHIHFLWILPANDTAYSKRVGRLKVKFTQSLQGKDRLPNNVSISRQKHRESNVWQRRFWEHTVKDEGDLEACLNYLHYNPVKHGLVTCPHLWSYSSFDSWVRKGGYGVDWGCVCDGKQLVTLNWDAISETLGE